jgi:cytochrome b involved in lipid metabolism
MSSKIILPILLVILVLLVGVGVYASFANLNPLRENKNFSNSQNSIVQPLVNSPQSISNKPSISINSQVNSFQQLSSVAVSSIQNQSLKSFSIADLNSHKTEADCYVSVLNKVYDVTAYVDQHPGGKDILKGCGKMLDGVRHPGGSFTGAEIQGILKEYYLGELK